jgi:hypothetical protein
VAFAVPRRVAPPAKAVSGFKWIASEPTLPRAVTVFRFVRIVLVMSHRL